MEEFTFETSQLQECVDITTIVKEIVKKSKVKDGICLVYTPHASAAIIINENADTAIQEDLIAALNHLIPRGKWRHDKLDGNADSHIKSSIIGPEKIIPVKNGKLMLGTWQAIMFFELDGPRKRKVIVSVVKEN